MMNLTDENSRTRVRRSRQETALLVLGFMNNLCEYLKHLVKNVSRDGEQPAYLESQRSHHVPTHY